MNVKSPNNTRKWQMEFNSAFKGLNKKIHIFLSQVYCVWQVAKTPTIIFNNPVLLIQFSKHKWMPHSMIRLCLCLCEKTDGVYYCNHPSPVVDIFFYNLCFNNPINNLLKLAKIHEFLLVITNILENNHWLCSPDQAVTTITRTNLFSRCVFQIVAAYIRWVFKSFLNLNSKLTGYAEMLTPTLLLNNNSQSSKHI
jgi:hypothetical protein